MAGIAHGDVDEGASETWSLRDLGLDERIRRGSELGEALDACGLAVSLHSRLEPLQSPALVVVTHSPEESPLQRLLGGVDLWRLWHQGATSINLPVLLQGFFELGLL